MTDYSSQISMIKQLSPSRRKAGAATAAGAMSPDAVRQHCDPPSSAAASSSKLPIFISALTLLLSNSKMVARAADLSVNTPSGSDVASGDTMTVEWTYLPTTSADDTKVPTLTTGDLTAFTIELTTCGDEGNDCSESSGTEGSCGDSYASLCTNDEGLCFDSDGQYDVIIPADTSAGQYGIKVALASDPTVVFACSGSFEVGDGGFVAGKPSLEVVTPDPLELGAAFTAQWAYYDTSGAPAAGTFKIDLYACEDDDCEG